MRIRASLGSIALLALSLACRDAPRRAAEAPPAADAPPAAEAAPVVAAADDDRLVSGTGIGRARAGMTLGELRRALPPELALGERQPFLVDVDGLPVIAGPDTLYHVLLPADEPAEDSLHLFAVATSHPSVRTAEGVGPGTTLALAARAYGEPTLGYNVEDESREYATFPRYASDAVRFRVGPASGATPFAGRYADGRGDHETTDYDPDARIVLVLVGLR